MPSTLGHRITDRSRSHRNVIAGVDVGGPKKGFHAVALSEGRIRAKTQSCDAADIARWCEETGASVVAVDAPCRWRSGPGARLAEREMARARISSFWTPTEERARGRAFFTWMIAGAQLYHALEDSYPVYHGEPGWTHVSIETFPQAIACALAGEIVPARRKRGIRAELLRLAGVDPSALRNIDEIDAALCAVAGDAFWRGDYRAYGDKMGGFIIVPSDAVPGFDGTVEQPGRAARYTSPAAQ